MKGSYFVAGAIATVLPLLCALPVRSQAQMMSEFPLGEAAQVTLPTTPIRVGEVVPGILNRDDSLVSGMYVQAFQFAGTEGDPIFIHLVGSFDQRAQNRLALNPYLIVINPAGQVVARTSAAPNTVNAFALLRLRASGNYTVLVSGAPAGQPGRYSLTVQRAEPQLVEGLTAPLTSDMGEAALEAQRSRRQ